MSVSGTAWTGGATVVMAERYARSPRAPSAIWPRPPAGFPQPARGSQDARPRPPIMMPACRSPSRPVRLRRLAPRACGDRAGRRLAAPGPAVVVTAWSTLESAAAAALIALPRRDRQRGRDSRSTPRPARTRRRSPSGGQARGGGRIRRAAAGHPQLGRRLRRDPRLRRRARRRRDRARLTRPQSTLAATLLGSVSTGVLHHTARPVLVARAG